MTEISGIWLPIITPFVDGAVDLAGYERLLAHYLARGVTGIFPLGTTGESPTLDEDEMEAIVDRTVAVVAGRVPIFVGIGGNATAKVLKTLAGLERYPFAGIVSVCPYYNRPSQDGLRAHFTRIAEATSREILIYNIPYRTASTSPMTPCCGWPSSPTSSASRTRPAIWPSPSSCCGTGRGGSRS